MDKIANVMRLLKEHEEKSQRLLTAEKRKATMSQNILVELRAAKKAKRKADVKNLSKLPGSNLGQKIDLLEEQVLEHEEKVLHYEGQVKRWIDEQAFRKFLVS